MSQRARQLVEDARKAISSVEERILLHPYLEALEKRRMGKGKLALFAGQQRHIVESGLRSVGRVSSREESRKAREFLGAMLRGETAALEALGAFGKALGLSTEQLRATEPIPGAFAFSAYVAWLSVYGTTAEFAGAFLANLDAWGRNCGRLGRALQSNYGFAASDLVFFELFAGEKSGFFEQGIAVLEDGLEEGVDPARIRRAARMLQGYELMFWDTIWDASRS
ncbi:MAG: hypothetical protein AB1346_08975 [Thermodesulfobacteriota bacterium]